MSAIADLLAIVNSDPDKTLDELILEHIGVAATDATLQVLVAEKFEVSKSTYSKVASFSSNANGTARLKGEVDESTIYAKIVDSSGNKQETYYNTATNTWESFYFDFNVKKGEKYDLYLRNTISSGSLSKSHARNIKICGSVSDPTLIVKE